MENISLTMRKDPSPHERQNVSFKFTKKTAKTLSGNRLDRGVSKQEKDYVLSVAKSEIHSSRPKEEKKDLVIPLIKKNKWRVLNQTEDHAADSEGKLRELAVQELLEETSEHNEKWENREFQNYTIAIPLIMQNKIPEGYETDDKMDVSLRPDESKLEDYNSVPVEQYGMAMLRGMGWKEGQPIGANSTKCVEPIQVEMRPKGLGLGADASAGKKTSNKSKDEKLELVKGAYLCVSQGPHKGQCGQVLGLDEENARVIVKLNSDEKIVTLPEFYVEVLSKKEYEKESRVINRASYVTHKKDHESRKEREHRSSHSKHERENSVENKSHSKEQYSSNSPKRKSVEQDIHPKKMKHSHEKSGEKYGNTDSSRAVHKSTKTWVRPQLKVRLIDDQYKKGKYFNQKLVVVDVLSFDNCICKTEDDRYLENISSSMLETVIPRDESSYVMIVNGKYAGELCTIMKKEKSKCMATVQFLSDRDKALKLEYDSICEFVGDISQYD